MKKLQQQLRPSVLSPLFFGLLLVFSYSEIASTRDFGPDCNEMGILFFNSDCEPFILLDDGLAIQAFDYGYPEILADSLRVRVGFEVLDSLVNNCINGFLVEITCLEILDPHALCQAQFIVYPSDSIVSDTPVGGYTYYFEDVSEGNVVDMHWFVDGDSIGNDVVQGYTFQVPGHHSVCLSILTDQGCYDNLCKEIYIGEQPPCYADFTYYPEDIFMITDDQVNGIIEGMPYRFIDQSRGDVIHWTWSMDGEVFESGPEFLYVFSEPGQYEICLSILTADSCSSTICKDIVIDSLPNCYADFDYYNPLDTDSFYYDFPGSRVIQFMDQSYGDVLSWQWEFGDGSSSNEQHPIHEFPDGGVYQVCLIIATASGCENIHCEEVFIDTNYWECDANFEYCTYNVAWMDTLNATTIIGFKNLSAPNAVYSWWDFGDGNWSEERNPIHIYNEPGVYETCLSIYSPGGCYDSYCERIFVGVDSCKVDFTHSLIWTDCAGYELAHLFSPIEQEEADYYYWDFGDGTFYYGREAAHKYDVDGTYKVCLEAVYQNGCIAYQCMEINTYWELENSVVNERCAPQDLLKQEDINVTNLYPVPASDILYVELDSETATDVSLQFINTLGQVTGEYRNFSLVAGDNTLEISLDDLKTGTYICRITTARGTVQSRLNVIK